MTLQPKPRIFTHIMQRTDRKALTHKPWAGIRMPHVPLPHFGSTWDHVETRDPGNKVWSAVVLLSLWMHRMMCGSTHPLRYWYSGLNRVTYGDILEASLGMSGHQDDAGVWYAFRPHLEASARTVEILWDSLDFCQIWDENSFMTLIEAMHMRIRNEERQNRRRAVRLAVTMALPNSLYQKNIVKQCIIDFLI